MLEAIKDLKVTNLLPTNLILTLEATAVKRYNIMLPVQRSISLHWTPIGAQRQFGGVSILSNKLLLQHRSVAFGHKPPKTIQRTAYTCVAASLLSSFSEHHSHVTRALFLNQQRSDCTPNQTVRSLTALRDEVMLPSDGALDVVVAIHSRLHPSSYFLHVCTHSVALFARGYYS